ncbi:hypothetical protein [Acanthopleuribacter pedis]|uniref:Uncharacterized protein n=1 Tax=Acanthopleuribacter pedis TaxID=442870 RepID=A0A8J7QC41_9BACT|nr:hypothetical protein [Acanthopleuribacter pedis]MBO1320989.1 hypothetical protein [Acanthopleuribacter pedis]MBO1323488.1 hypothetical protein [Acanthopleuribacter pedis]
MRFGLSLLFCLVAPLVAQEIVINPPTPTNNGLFGNRTASIADRLFVTELGSNNFTGSVHIYRVTGGQPQFLQTLDNPDGQGRNFGFALDAVSTEAGLFLAIGAAFNNVPASQGRGGTVQSGEVLIYFDSAADMEDTFTLLSRLDLREFNQSDMGFGNALDLDLVPGGFELAVGATRFTNPNSQLQSGAVAIYTSTDATTWMRGQLIQPDNVTAGGEFGLPVELQDSQLFVGASNDSVAMTQSGSCYLYTRSAQTKNLFQEQAKFQASDADTLPFAAFGENFTLLPNGTLVIAAPRTPANNIVPGRVYVFNAEGAQGDVTETQAINPTNPVDNGFFGVGLTSSHDNRLFIGDPSTVLNQNNNAGSILEFGLEGGTWTFVQSFTQGDPAAEAFFGDTIKWLQIGEPFYLAGGAPSRSSKGAAFSGQVSLFEQESATPIFSDGFESGDTSVWSSSTPFADFELEKQGELLAVLRGARFKGAFGMQVAGNAGTAFVESTGGDSATDFRCRVQFSTNDLDLPINNRLRILAAGSLESGRVPWLAVELYRDGQGTNLQLLAREDSALMRMSDPITLSGPWHGVEVALIPGDSNGSVSLRVNSQTVTVGSLTNTGANVDFMRIGVMPASTPATETITGSVYFDDFAAQAGGTIGNACLNDADFRTHASDWDGGDILFLVSLLNLPCQ